jgi:ketosteroid isomerase-like protein
MSGPISALGLPQSAPGRAVPEWLAAFYRAYLTRDAALLDAVLHDDIEWSFPGPAEQIDYFGHRRGKDAVIEAVTRIMPCFLRPTDFEVDHLVIRDGCAALYGRVRARQRDTGRSLFFRSSHFLQARNGRVVSFRVIADTFDATEQLVGHPIDVNTRIETVQLVPAEDELLSL